MGGGGGGGKGGGVVVGGGGGHRGRWNAAQWGADRWLRLRGYTRGGGGGGATLDVKVVSQHGLRRRLGADFLEVTPALAAAAVQKTEQDVHPCKADKWSREARVLCSAPECAPSARAAANTVRNSAPRQLTKRNADLSGAIGACSPGPSRAPGHAPPELRDRPFAGAACMLVRSGDSTYKYFVTWSKTSGRNGQRGEAVSCLCLQFHVRKCDLSSANSIYWVQYS